MSDQGGAPDWLDTRRRARALGRRQNVRRRMVVAAFLAAAIGVPAAVAGVATGLIPGFRGEPAPALVQESIASFARTANADLQQAAVARGVRPTEARGVLAFRTELGTIRIWVAPTDTGERCRFLQVGQSGTEDKAFSCGPATASALQFSSENLGKGVILVDGRAQPQVTSVQLQLKDGSTQDLALVDGYFAGLSNSENMPQSLTIDRGEAGKATFPVPTPAPHP